MEPILQIDGNFEEGGGQILRSALALSCITKKPFDIKDIRKNREQPGLKHQHLHCIKALQQIYDCRVEDAYLGSEKIRFIPGKLKKRTIDIDIGTAGSITLLLQSIMLAVAFENKTVRVKIKGGTDVKWSMSWDYFNEILIPNIRRVANIETKLLKRGYYPVGGGQVELKIKPIEKREWIRLEKRGKIIHVKGVSHASRDLIEAEVSERQASSAKQVISELNCPIKIDARYNESQCTGSGITLWATYSLDNDEIDVYRPIRIGSDYYGEKGVRAEEIGSKVANKLLKIIYTGAVVDEHLCDNLIPYLGLLKGEIKTNKITKHTKANIYVCEKFLGIKYKIEDNNISVN